MDRKAISNKAWKKTGFGILFVAACFMAMYILMEFHEVLWLVILAAVILLGAAFLFFYAVFSDKTKIKGTSFDVTEDSSVSGGGEFHLKIVKHMKDMENSQKEMVEVLKSQNALLQAQTENMENSLFALSEKQSNQTKSIIKFNKENARQLAISERETLEYIMLEIKSAIEENSGGTMRIPETAPVAALEEITGDELFEVEEFEPDDEYVAPVPAAPEEVVSVPEEIPEEIAPLFEEPASEAEPSLDELLMEVKQEEDPFAEVADSEEMDIPELPEDLDLSQLFDIPELEEESVTTDAAPEAEEPASATNPTEILSADPNAMMTPEDIAKLLEAMGQ